MRAIRLAAIVVCLLAVGRRAESDPPPAGAPPAPKAGETGARLTLLEPGAEPRVAIRYHPKVGTKAVYEILTTSKKRMGDAPHLTVETTTQVADVEVLSVEKDGSARMRMVVRDLHVDMPGQPAADAKQVNEALQGLRFHLAARVSPLGAWSETDIGLDADPSGRMAGAIQPMVDSLGQTLNQISVRLPEEPVGVGARWKVEGSMTALGLTVTSTGTMTLKSIDGDAVVLENVTSGAGKDQKLTMGGVDSDVHEMKTDGTGTFTLDLGSAIVSNTEMTTKSTVRMTVHVPDRKPVDMSVDSTVEMKFAPKK